MKCCKRYLSLLLVCVSLFLVFSATASAEEIQDFTLAYNFYVQEPDGTLSALQGQHFVYGQGEYGTKLVEKTTFDTSSNDRLFRGTMQLYYDDKSIVVEKDKNTTITIDNIYVAFGDRMSLDQGRPINQPKQVRKITYSFHYADNTYSNMFEVDSSCWVYNALNKTHSIEIDMKPTKDVRRVYIHEYFGLQSYFTNPVTDIAYIEFGFGNDGVGVNVEVETKEQGLLGSIIEWIKGIFNSIGEGFTKMAEGFTNIINKLGEGFKNIVDSLIELPQKLWTLISDGLKSLFVPDDEFIVTFKSDMESMLSEKLGAVYQVIDITQNSWDRIQSNDENNTIILPETTIDLPDNNNFSFGGYDIQIVPQGFEFIASIIKTVIGIVCTIMCVNGLRKKYDEVMGVEQ